MVHKRKGLMMGYIKEKLVLIFVYPWIIVQFTKKIQQDTKVYQNFISYMKLNMFWATHRPSSGA